MDAAPRDAATPPPTPLELGWHGGIDRAASHEVAEAGSLAQTMLTVPLNVLRGRREVDDTLSGQPPVPRATEFTLAPSRAAAVDVEPAAGSNEQLPSLIETCCSRLWVNDGGGAAKGVLLDLGRWMPSCTIEIAKAAGVLRVTLRGAEVDRFSELGHGLSDLSERLAQKLGCPVVAAVEEAPR